jgi:hypothetical protein
LGLLFLLEIGRGETVDEGTQARVLEGKREGEDHPEAKEE